MSQSPLVSPLTIATHSGATASKAMAWLPRKPLPQRRAAVSAAAVKMFFRGLFFLSSPEILDHTPTVLEPARASRRNGNGGLISESCENTLPNPSSEDHLRL